jgi:thiamine biosynthesis lipoprotein
MMKMFAFQAIGTSWEIETPEPLAAAVQKRIRACLDEVDSSLSRFRTDSTTSAMAMSPEGGHFQFPAETQRLFELYDRLHDLTKGAVDPLVGRDLELLGYDAVYSLQHDPIEIARYSHERRIWRDDIERTGTTIHVRKPVVLDVGAAGKGYCVDLVAAILAAEGLGSFVIDAGGDIVHRGEVELVVGLEHPFDAEQAIGLVTVKDCAICASATNRRAWGQFNHIVDGRTGVPVKEIAATWVIASDAMTADGLATALFFTSGEALAPHFDYSFVRMFADGRAEVSSNFEGEIFY